MNIRSVRLKKKAVEIDYVEGNLEQSMCCTERPIPEFCYALDALAPIMADILHLPKAYFTDELFEVTGLTISEKQGVRCVTLVGNRTLPDSSSPANFATPLRFLEHPEVEGTYTPALPEKQVKLIEVMLERAAKYIKGERAQGLLPFEDKVDDYDDENATGQNTDKPEDPNDPTLFPKK